MKTTGKNEKRILENMKYIIEKEPLTKDQLHHRMRGIMSMSTRWKYISAILNKTSWESKKTITIEMLNEIK